MANTRKIPVGVLIAERDTAMSVRIPGLIRERLAEQAAKEGRSISNMLTIALYEWLNARNGVRA